MKNIPPLNVLGIMSGSSLDGLDLALCKFSIQNNKLDWQCLQTNFYPIHHDLKTQLSKGENSSAKELFQLEQTFNQASIAAIQDFKNQNPEIDLVASHGHTIAHYPKDGITIQIGNGGYMSSQCKVAVVSDFRIQDVALGGEGTPLVSKADQDLFEGHDYFLNLGGIANISINKGGKWSAYDVCPCNQVLNYFANKNDLDYDSDGQLSQAGQVDQNALAQWKKEPYFNLQPPKSLDNNWIKNTWLPFIEASQLSIEDGLATYVECIADCIADQVPNSPIERSMLITGGGAFNSYLINKINQKLKQKHVKTVLPSVEIINYKEAILMAYLGFLRFHQLPNVDHRVTGATSPVSAGALYLPPAL